jgi:hypothetical protein
MHMVDCLAIDLVVLGLLQILCIVWLFDIAKGVYAFIVYGEADDHRSDDEEEEEDGRDRATKKDS